MDINYKEVADRAVMYARQSNINLDFTKESIEKVENILLKYYENLDQYDGKEGGDTLWNIAVHFGIYLGEAMLKLQLEEQGFYWYIDDDLPILKNDNNIQLSPITKAHKQILNGPEDSVNSFCNVAFSVANGNFPTRNVHRAINIKQASGECTENVLYRDIDSYISLVENGVEDFIILNSHDGFLQFFGYKDQFVLEIHVDLADKDFRTYSVIDKGKENAAERIRLVTPFGEFTPEMQEVITYDLVKMTIRKYYENINESDLLKEIPYKETTEEMKECMGLL